MTTSHAEADTHEDREDSAGVDLTALAHYLDSALDGGVRGDLAVSLISGGRSNPTYRVADADRTWVLRRPPYGHVLPSAHDMKREFTVIRGLAGTAVPVPDAVLLCEDKDSTTCSRPATTPGRSSPFWTGKWPRSATPSPTSGSC